MTKVSVGPGGVNDDVLWFRVSARGVWGSKLAEGPRAVGACDIPIVTIWEFPKMRGTLVWGPYNKDPTI